MLRYFETQDGSYVNIDTVSKLAIRSTNTDTAPEATGDHALIGFTDCGSEIKIGLWDTLKEAEHRKIGLVLWAVADGPPIYSVAGKDYRECPAAKLARLGPGVIEILESSALAHAMAKEHEG